MTGDVEPINGDVEALLTERAGYERRGLANRVAQVDAALAAYGVAADAPIEAAVETPPVRRGPGRPRKGS